jgi:hypothetical protein
MLEQQGTFRGAATGSLGAGTAAVIYSGKEIRDQQMKIFRAVALAGLLAGPAYAQMPNVNLLLDGPGKTQDQIDQEQARDKAYKDSLRKIPDAKASTDPWGDVRGNDAPKAEKRVQAKPRTKTGSTAN